MLEHLRWREWGGKGDSQGLWALRAGLWSFYLFVFSKNIKHQHRVWVPGKMGGGFLFKGGEMETDRQTDIHIDR